MAAFARQLAHRTDGGLPPPSSVRDAGLPSPSTPCIISPEGDRKRLRVKTPDAHPGIKAAMLLPVCKEHKARSQMAACPRPLHPELAQRRWLPSFASSMASALGGAAIQRLAMGLGLEANTTRVITVGTVCSGSELYMLSLEPVATILSALTGCIVSFQHKWSCEKNPRKRDWIRDNFRVEHLFGDLLEMGNGHARDELTGRLVPICSVDVLIAGFSCKDASRLNIHHGARLDAVEASSHTTGSTFAGFVRRPCLLLRPSSFSSPRVSSPCLHVLG